MHGISIIVWISHRNLPLSQTLNFRYNLGSSFPFLFIHSSIKGKYEYRSTGAYRNCIRLPGFHPYYLSRCHVETTELINFPESANVLTQLSWLGEDYRDYILESLYSGLRQQDPEVQIQSLTCQQPPQITVTDADQETVKAMSARFELVAVFQDGHKQCWRMNVSALYLGEDLHHPETLRVQSHIDILQEAEI